MIKIIKQSRLIQRHPFSFFSFGAQGQKGTDTELMFGYIAKNKDGTDRRCHVVFIEDVHKLIDVLTTAINVNTFDAQANASTSNDGFTVPAPPMRHRSSLHRQSFVSNCRAPTVTEDVVGKVWYHGNLSREDAQALLKTEGDFLVRQSDHTPGKYVLSGRTAENEHKHLILLDNHNRVRTRDRTFSNISELIDYHVNNGMAVRSEGRDRETSLNLIRPVPCPGSDDIE
ncbi:SHC-transforming protein homolog 1 [Caenorhabditis elegans]|nr:SHC-transforming protein homolog 1 [Caenorhabditis elegans]CCD68062.2 SHC-transforming protein homolog 1 [Caenorhabditis elegans]|eukprot:NP_490800.2 SHC-transforming protein homolog 1 [Caenorhabditis elegans]